MKVSYRWLDEYFKEELPRAEMVADTLTMNSSEVDSVEKVDDDFVFDVKILPNMAHSCLCHRGIARELSALLDLPMKNLSREFVLPKYNRMGEINETEISKIKLEIKIENPKDCRRYIGRVLENIRIGPSPEWLKNRLETLGQRSINNLVDATNFVMLEIGQPMHVFDADKLGGSVIEIKRAKVRDEIKTLDGKDVILDQEALVISNNNKALAIAGIKGGTLAEINTDTKNIVLESANFDPVLIRKTAQKLKIQTDASKRYENELTPTLCEEAMDILTVLILEIAGHEETKVGKVVDNYPIPVDKYRLGVSVTEVKKVLGLEISELQIENIFRRFDFVYKKEDEQLVIDVPAERLDLRIKEDLIEEIGRVYGYDKLADNNKLDTKMKGQINKSFYYANIIKEIMLRQGFSEIYGYTFAEKGEVELANSVAPEKKFLRNNLTNGLAEYLEFNARYSELISMSQIKIFEIGKVFSIGEEHNNFIFGVETPVGVKGLKKEKEVLEEVSIILEEELGVRLVKINNEENIAEFNFDELVAKLPEPERYGCKLPVVDKDMRFKKISLYPFILRDVAVLTPEDVDAEKVLKIILAEAGDLLIKYRLFDTFKRSEKVSYAFHLVFQSLEKTLSDEEINEVMTIITSKLNAQKDWQVR